MPQYLLIAITVSLIFLTTSNARIIVVKSEHALPSFTAETMIGNSDTDFIPFVAKLRYVPNSCRPPPLLESEMMLPDVEETNTQGYRITFRRLGSFLHTPIADSRRLLYGDEDSGDLFSDSEDRHHLPSDVDVTKTNDTIWFFDSCTSREVSSLLKVAVSRGIRGLLFTDTNVTLSPEDLPSSDENGGHRMSALLSVSSDLPLIQEMKKQAVPQVNSTLYVIATSDPPFDCHFADPILFGSLAFSGVWALVAAGWLLPTAISRSSPSPLRLWLTAAAVMRLSECVFAYITWKQCPDFGSPNFQYAAVIYMTSSTLHSTVFLGAIMLVCKGWSITKERLNPSESSSMLFWLIAIYGTSSIGIFDSETGLPILAALLLIYLRECLNSLRFNIRMLQAHVELASSIPALRSLEGIFMRKYKAFRIMGGVLIAYIILDLLTRLTLMVALNSLPWTPVALMGLETGMNVALLFLFSPLLEETSGELLWTVDDTSGPPVLPMFRVKTKEPSVHHDRVTEGNVCIECPDGELALGLRSTETEPSGHLGGFVERIRRFVQRRRHVHREAVEMSPATAGPHAPLLDEP